MILIILRKTVMVMMMPVKDIMVGSIDDNDKTIEGYFKRSRPGWLWWTW